MNLQPQKMIVLLFTCEHGSPQPLYPVAPHAEAQQGLEAIEGPDSDLRHEVRGEIQAGQ